MENTHQEEIVVLRFRTQVLEDRLFPVPFHVIPILNLTVANGVVDSIAGCLCICKGFVADEEVEILDAALGCEMTGLGRQSRSRATCLRRGSARRYRGGEDTRVG